MDVGLGMIYFGPCLKLSPARSSFRCSVSPLLAFKNQFLIDLRGSSRTLASMVDLDKLVDASSNPSYNAAASKKGAESKDVISIGAAVEDLSQYPVPVTPLAGGKDIEYERAMVSEAAMKTGPAITKENVIFEDEWLLIVNKPCGVYSEHVLISVPTLWDHQYSSKYPIEDKARVLPHLHLANRLDRDTSGVLVITKCKVAAGRLSKIFESRNVRKSYVALCTGALPAWKSVTIESGHGKSRYGCWRVYCKQDVGRALPGGSLVKEMATKVAVLGFNKSTSEMNQVPLNSNSTEEQLIVVGAAENVPPVLDDAETTGEVLVRAFPLTGRTHQIRLHCQYLGLPLVGDVKYSGPLVWNGQKSKSHCLHAESIFFKHPMTDEDVSIVAPQPHWAAGCTALHSLELTMQKIYPTT